MSNPFTQADVLAGRFFHTIRHEEGCGCRRADWQGKVIGLASADTYLVQLFEWVMGYPSAQRLVPLEELVRRDTEFHDSAEAMNDAYHRLYEEDCSHLKQRRSLVREGTARGLTILSEHLYWRSGQWWADVDDRLCTTLQGEWCEFLHEDLDSDEADDVAPVELPVTAADLGIATSGTSWDRIDLGADA